MEKYCPACGKVLGEVNFKFCPYCKSELHERVGRQHIPNHLRHAVLKRDDYRCVECGATNKETTLEIDHILPVAKGGTNDINNLQTLCKHCNRAKSATVWDSKTDLSIKKEQLKHLENRLSDYKYKLNHAKTEDENIEYKFEIQRLNEKILSITKIIEDLAIKEKQREEDFNRKQEMKHRKNILFKKLYLELDDFDLTCLSLHFSVFEHIDIPKDYNLFDSELMPYKFKEDQIKWIVKNYEEIEIYDGLKIVDKNNSFANEIYENYDTDFLSDLSNSFIEYANRYNDKSCYFLVNKYSIDTIAERIQILEEKTAYEYMLNNYPNDFLRDLSIYLFKESFSTSQEIIQKIVIEVPEDKIYHVIDEVKKLRQTAAEIYSLYYYNIYYEKLSNFYSNRDERFSIENYSSYVDMIYELICVYSIREIKDRLHNIVFKWNSVKKLSKNLSNLTLKNLIWYYDVPKIYSDTKKMEFMVNKSSEDEITKLIKYFDGIYYKLNFEALDYLWYHYKLNSKNRSKRNRINYLIINYSSYEVNNILKIYYEKKSFIEEMDKKLDNEFLSKLFDLFSEPGKKQPKKKIISKVIKTKSMKEIQSTINKVNENSNIKSRYCSVCLNKANKYDKFCVNCGEELQKKNSGLFNFNLQKVVHRN